MPQRIENKNKIKKRTHTPTKWAKQHRGQEALAAMA
jgi:hypothetical protein